MKKVFICFLLFFFLLPQDLSFAKDAKEITPSQVSKLSKKGAVLLDIRRKDEWDDTGYIKDSLLITAFDKYSVFQRSFIKQFIKQVKKNDNIIIICRTGNKAGTLSKILKNNGYNNLFILKGGIKEWKKQKYPTVGEKEKFLGIF